MSIYVEGMKMPRSCIECPFVAKERCILNGDQDCDYKVRLVYNCLLKLDDIEDGWINFEKADGGRQEFCPLVEGGRV